MLSYLQHTRFNRSRFDLKSCPRCHWCAQHKPTALFIENDTDHIYLRPNFLHT